MKCLFYSLIFSFSFTASFSQGDVNAISHYVFPEFIQGKVLMKNGSINKAFVNYNSITEEMLFQEGGTVLAIGKAEMDRIDTVYIKNRKFFALNNKFVELLFQSNSELYAEYKCKVIPPSKDVGYGGSSETSAVRSVSAMNSGGRLYDLKLPADYDISPYNFYWLKKDGDLKRFTNLKQLMKLYGDEKDIFKEYVKKNNIKYENQESIVQIIRYMEIKNSAMDLNHKG